MKKTTKIQKPVAQSAVKPKASKPSVQKSPRGTIEDAPDLGEEQAP